MKNSCFSGMAQILNYTEKDFPVLRQNVSKETSSNKNLKNELCDTSKNNIALSSCIRDEPQKSRTLERKSCDSYDGKRMKNFNKSAASVGRDRCFKIAIKDLLSEHATPLAPIHRNSLTDPLTSIVPGHNPLDSDKPFRFKGKQKREKREKRLSRTKTLVHEARKEHEKLKECASKVHVQGEFVFVNAPIPNECICKCLFSEKERDLKPYLRKLENFNQNYDADYSSHKINIRDLDIMKTECVSCENQIMSNNDKSENSMNIIHLRDILKHSEIPPYECLIHKRNFKRYCNNYVTKELNGAAEALINQLVRFQCNKYRINPTKATANKRYVMGLKQVKKYVQWNKAKLVIIVPDMEDSLRDLVEELKSLTSVYSIPYLFALSRRRLGFLIHKKVGVSCFGVLDASGAEINLKKLVDVALIAKKSYKEDYKRAKEFYETYLHKGNEDSSVKFSITDEIISDFQKKLQLQQDTNTDEEEEILPEIFR